MQIKSLEVFLAVVRLGSFSEAAKDLYTVQSNITSHIKKLEQELNVQLLNRQIPVTPTSAGLQLLSHAEKMINIKNEIFASFLEHQIEKNYPLKIGSMETTAAIRLPSLFQNLQISCPDLKFSLSTGSSRFLIEQVKNAQLDCAFVSNEYPIEGLFNYHVWTEKLVLISSQQAPEHLSAEYLSAQKFIAFKQGCNYRRSIEAFLLVHQLPATQIIDIASLDGIVSCVSLNIGLAILPLKYVEQSHFYSQIKVHEIDHPLAYPKTFLIADDPAKWCTNMNYFLENLVKLA